ncbi:hypothetical protein KAH81_00080 [bacterium]|nr:hypothetical protein [bacterium]
MPEYSALSPSAEVKGNAMLAIIEGMMSEELARTILAKYGITDIHPDKWYPEQSWLDVFSDIAGELGDAALYSIGRTIPKVLDLPKNIHNAHEAVEKLNDFYQSHHRGGNSGSYIVTDLEDRSARIISHNPRPCAYDMGFLSAYIGRFNDSKPVKVEHEDDMCCRKVQYPECVYIINW